MENHSLPAGGAFRMAVHKAQETDLKRAALIFIQSMNSLFKFNRNFCLSVPTFKTS